MQQCPWLLLLACLWQPSWRRSRFQITCPAYRQALFANTDTLNMPCRAGCLWVRCTVLSGCMQHSTCKRKAVMSTHQIWLILVFVHILLPSTFYALSTFHAVCFVQADAEQLHGTLQQGASGFVFESDSLATVPLQLAYTAVHEILTVESVVPGKHAMARSPHGR